MKVATVSFIDQISTDTSKELASNFRFQLSFWAKLSLAEWEAASLLINIESRPRVQRKVHSECTWCRRKEA